MISSRLDLRTPPRPTRIAALSLSHHRLGIMARVMAMAAIAFLALRAMPASAADPAAGEMVFEQKCFGCHAVGDGAVNKFGPQLNALFGRSAGSLPGYAYSKAFRAYGIPWSKPTFAAFIRDPRKAVPGTTMPFAGLKSEQEIADLTAYLEGFAEDGQWTQ